LGCLAFGAGDQQTLVALLAVVSEKSLLEAEGTGDLQRLSAGARLPLALDGAFALRTAERSRGIHFAAVRTGSGIRRDQLLTVATRVLITSHRNSPLLNIIRFGLILFPTQVIGQGGSIEL
jgi:hypothetical protein